jgi:hypothetical protein
MAGRVDALVAAIVMPVGSATVLAVALISIGRPLRARSAAAPSTAAATTAFARN